MADHSNTQGSDVEVLPAGTPPATVNLTDLEPLIGLWSGPAGFAGFSAPSGGHLVGHLVLTDDNGVPRLTEPWVFKTEPEGVRLLYKLFTTDMKGLQEKDEWAHRWVVGKGEGFIQLDNMTLVISSNTLELVAVVKPENELPRRVIYSFRRPKR